MKLKELIKNIKIIESSTKKKFKIQSLEDFLDEEGVEKLEEAKLGTDFSATDYNTDDLKNNLGRSENNTRFKSDKYKKPRIHSSTAKEIKITDMNDNEYDLDKLKNIITSIPKSILKANKKMKNTKGENVRFYNLGLPAIKGLVFDEEDKKFKIVSTCPHAGVCQLYCYAHKGGYVQFKNASLAPTKVLNLLVNHPDKFEEMLTSELQRAVKSASKDDTQVILRWHDSGDFFSPSYADIAFKIARKFPTVKFYAYTKDASLSSSNKKPENFLFNFSDGAKSSQTNSIDFENTKNSRVIEKTDFFDLIVTNEKGHLIKDEHGKMQYKSPKALNEFKERLAKKFKRNFNNVITYDELMKKPEKNEMKWSVIVAAGDGDDAAARKDVLDTFLLIH